MQSVAGAGATATGGAGAGAGGAAGAGMVSGGAGAQMGGASGVGQAGTPVTGGAAGNAGGGSGGMGGGAGAGDTSTQPLLGVLDKFTAPDVPVRGPDEADPHPLTSMEEVTTLPGMGLAQHPFIYVGENYNTILLVNQGKVIWKYDTKGGFELDDIWMLSNGNVLYSHMSYIEEITPNKQVVWHYDSPANSEIHTCQPIGLDKVMIGMNQMPSPKVLVINTQTKTVELEHTLPDAQGVGVHGQMRRMRMTAAGTYLVAWLSNGKVVEYDKDFNPIWTYKTPKPWSVSRLHNGHTLIQDEAESTCKEVDALGNLVWSWKKSEISFPNAKLEGNNQTCERLASGNSVMFNHSPGGGNAQMVEVAQDKHVVWAIQDYKHLGDATSAQFLDEPGIPEVVGATEH
jgi:hypothetical protein